MPNEMRHETRDIRLETRDLKHSGFIAAVRLKSECLMSNVFRLPKGNSSEIRSPYLIISRKIPRSTKRNGGFCFSYGQQA